MQHAVILADEVDKRSSLKLPAFFNSIVTCNVSVILAIFTSMSSAHQSYRNGRVLLFYDYNSIYIIVFVVQ